MQGMIFKIKFRRLLKNLTLCHSLRFIPYPDGQFMGIELGEIRE